MNKITAGLIIVSLLLSFIVIPVSAQEDFCFFEIGGLSTVRQPANNISVSVVVAHTCEDLDSFVITKIEILNNDDVIIRSETVNQSLEAIGEMPEWIFTLSMPEIEADPELYTEYGDVMSNLVENGYFSSFMLDLSEITNDLVVGNNYSVQAKVTVLHNGDTVELIKTHEFAYQPSLPGLHHSAGWYSGDAHIHSCHSEPECYPCWNPFGWATVQAIAEDARDFGLDWIVLTDHSYLLDSDEWNQERQECTDESITGEFICMCGEELSVYDGGFIPDGSAHYLCHGISEFIPNTGVYYPNVFSPDTPTAEDAIAEVTAQGGAGFIAHPHSWPFSWDRWDLSGYTGLEVWNGPWDEDDATTLYNPGTPELDSWVELLLAGKHVVGIADSDSHQGLASGFTVGYEPPVWNYLFLSSLTENDIIDALKNGRAVMTNGPLVIFDITNEMEDKAIIGDSISGFALTLNMEWISTFEFGLIDEIRVLLGDVDENSETEIYSFDPGFQTWGTRAIDLTSMVPQESDFYIRVEASADNWEKRVYTNPIWAYLDINTLTVSAGSGGTVTTPGIGDFGPYDPGHVVDLVAEADDCYEFRDWTGDVDTIADVNDATTTITMYGDYSITANFVKLSYDLTTYSITGGSVTTPGEGTFPYDCGTVVDLVAKADDCYEFRDWTGDVGTIADVNDATTTITMYGDYSIQANFVLVDMMEDFEWGSDGDSLATDGGDVDWTVSKLGWWGNSRAEIDTAQKHTGTKSARLYRGSYGFSYMLAYYSQTPYPESRKFYFYFEEGSNAVLYTYTGDGDYRIYVKISLGGDGDDVIVGYYDGDSWNEYTVYYPTWIDKWRCLEFENIDWVNHTYNIRCDSVPIIGVHMRESGGPQWTTAYYNAGGSGSECWIDDILE